MPGPAVLSVGEVRDRAQVFLNRQPVGATQRAMLRAAFTVESARAKWLRYGAEYAQLFEASMSDPDAAGVLALFGSIAGAESVLLALDDELRPVVAMAEAPHGTAPSLLGKNVANPMAMLLACAAALDHAAAKGDADIARAARAIRQTTLSVAADGIRTFDLGGDESTSGVVDAVLLRLRLELAQAR